MIESLVQSADALKLLPDLKEDIRNGAQMGASQALIERILAPEKMRPDERGWSGPLGWDRRLEMI